MKRILSKTLATLALCMMTAGVAWAGEVEATIVEIQPDTGKLVLSDGTSYEIPVDFFVDDLKSGMRVLVFFDEGGSAKTLTDVQILN
ncbi:DUF1344 domain-containing protein [Stappia sp. MMSF_3263]|uniref:DUF1344 domain-containing protein n=1 Tax=Stappia sp. MMSF_3263 TaxID=3046693 RepID=UPI00273E1793|nr:DUF1344 domain-containing protein [Stappia sp. MMSF_3263]